jgi:hypothetical protein
MIREWPCDGTAAGHCHAEVVETHAILADQVAEPIHVDVSPAQRGIERG